MPAVIDLFSNVAATTLAAAVTTTPAAGTSETWTLTSSAAPLPQAVNGVSQYRATVGPGTDTSPEIVWVTATLTGTTVTVLRGQEGSTVKTHAIGDAFTHTATAGFFTNTASVTTTTNASKTLQPGEQCFFTGSTASQTITLPSAPTSSSPTSVTNNSSVNVTVARGGSDTITHYLTTSLTSIVIPPGMGISFTYAGGVWYTISGTGFVPGQILGETIFAPNSSVTAATVSGTTMTVTAAGTWNVGMQVSFSSMTGTGSGWAALNTSPTNGGGYVVTTGGTGSFHCTVTAGTYTTYGGGGVVNQIVYTGPQGAAAWSSNNLVAVDTTNLTLSFVVPPNGKVLLTTACDWNYENSTTNSWDFYIGYLNHSGGALVGAPGSMFGSAGFPANTYAIDGHGTFRTAATGLTPGALQVDLACGPSNYNYVSIAAIVASGAPTISLANDQGASLTMTAQALA